MFIGSFIGYLKAERNYSQHTLRAYEGDLRSFQEFLSRVDEPVDFFGADLDLVRSWVSELMDAGAAPSSVCRKLSALRSFYSYCRETGGVDVNPVAALQGPKRRKRLPVFVREEDMNTLIDELSFGEGYAACRDRMIIVLFYETGIRLSELIGLDVADVDMGASLIKVTGKRDKQRIVPFAAELKRELENYFEARAAVADVSDEALFLSGKGRRISQSAVYRLVGRQLSRVTSVAKRSPHVLRHSFATAMLNNDAEIGVVKELLGHERIATTEIYTHLTFEELKRNYKKAHPRAGNN